MNPLRLVLVARRFWPTAGSAERITANLAVELAARGQGVTVLTAQWQPGWPEQIRYHEVPVVRLPRPPEGGLNTLGWMRCLARWLRENLDQFDLAWVSGLRHEAYAALRALRGRVPVVLQAEASGRQGDCLWQLDAACGRRIKQQCLRAAALVAVTPGIEQELKAAGYPRPRIHHLPLGVPIPPPRTPATKTAARAVLAETNVALETPPWAPLAVSLGTLEEEHDLRHLVAAWKAIVARWPDARLWLAGVGPAQQSLRRQIEAANLASRVVPVGVLDEPDELLAAADLFIQRCDDGGVPLSLLEAMAVGLPVVACDTANHRALVDDGRQGLLLPAADAPALTAAVAGLLERPEEAARLGAAARQRAAAEFSLAKMVDAHVTLFQRLLSKT